MPNSHERVRTKTKVIFTEIAGDRAARLDPSNALEDMKSNLQYIMSIKDASEYKSNIDNLRKQLSQ